MWIKKLIVNIIKLFENYKFKIKYKYVTYV